MADNDRLTAALEEIQARAACPDPDPCVNGPMRHQWHTSCQMDRDL